MKCELYDRECFSPHCSGVSEQNNCPNKLNQEKRALQLENEKLKERIKTFKAINDANGVEMIKLNKALDKALNLITRHQYIVYCPPGEYDYCWTTNKNIILKECRKNNNTHKQCWKDYLMEVRNA